MCIPKTKTKTWKSLNKLISSGITVSYGRLSCVLFLFFQASEVSLQYPGWALAVLSLLIIFAMLPVPLVFIHSFLKDRAKPESRDAEIGQYSLVSTDDKCETPMTDMSELDQRNGTAAPVSS